MILLRNTSPGALHMAVLSRRSVSLDLWAVMLSLALALLVRFGLITRVPW